MQHQRVNSKTIDLFCTIFLEATKTLRKRQRGPRIYIEDIVRMLKCGNESSRTFLILVNAGFARTLCIYSLSRTLQTSFSHYSLGLLLTCSILLMQVPMPSRPTSTTSPSFSHIAGFLPEPTPCGVPVKIKSPGRRVVP